MYQNMKQRHIGIILIFVGITFALLIYAAKAREDYYIKQIVIDKGTCILEDGFCLHSNSNYLFYTIGLIVTLTLGILGTYLIYFDKSQKMLEENQIKITKALEEAKKQEKQKDEFGAYLAAFSEDEKKILAAVREQEGIRQSTLRYRTGLSKTTLSLILKSLEERQIISKKESGKSNEVYLRKKF